MDINDIITEIIPLVRWARLATDVTSLEAGANAVYRDGDLVELQSVLVNLVMNDMETLGE